MTQENGPASVPYIVHEAEMARIEREHDKERDQWNKERDQHKRTVRWLCAIIIILALGVIGMFVYEAQFEEITITAEQEADGDSNNYAVGGDFYGLEAESNDKTPNP